MKKGHITPDTSRGRVAVEGMGDWWFSITTVKYILMPFLVYNRPIILYKIDHNIKLAADNHHPISRALGEVGKYGPLSIVILPLLGLITFKHVHPIMNIAILLFVGIGVTYFVYRRKDIKRMRVLDKKQVILHADQSKVREYSIRGTVLGIFFLPFVLIAVFDNSLLAEFFWGLVISFILHTYDDATIHVDDVQVEFLDEEKSKGKQELGE